MDRADSAFARLVHERVLNTLHLIIIGQSGAEVLHSTGAWIDEPDERSAHAPARGLAEAIRDAVLRSGVTGVEIDFLEGADGLISRAIGEALSAAIVEALRNAQRHAQASGLSVQARRDADWVHVEVRDDGRGFDADANPRLGLALGINDALESVAGTAQIRSDARRGTVVLLSVPAASPQTGTDFADGHLIREWPRVSEGARRLIADLVDGHIDLQSPDVTDRARLEDCRIRTWLDCNRVDSWMARQVASVVGQAADHGRRVTATISGRAGISRALDFDLAVALADAEAFMLTVDPDHEELLVIVRGAAELRLKLHEDLPWRIDPVGQGARGIRISRIR
jgi:hypothetical protein